MKKPHPSGIRGAPTCFCEHVGLSAFSAEAGDTLSAQANGRRTTRVLGRDKSLTCSPGGRPLLPTPPLPSVRTAPPHRRWLRGCPANTPVPVRESKSTKRLSCRKSLSSRRHSPTAHFQVSADGPSRMSEGRRVLKMQVTSCRSRAMLWSPRSQGPCRNLAPEDTPTLVHTSPGSGSRTQQVRSPDLPPREGSSAAMHPPGVLGPLLWPFSKRLPRHTPPQQGHLSCYGSS